MNVGLMATGIWTEIEEVDFLHAFFSTIAYRLESGNWGSKYPNLLNKLYYEKLDSVDIAMALDELNDIREKFDKMKLDDIVWDIENLGIKVPESRFLSSKDSNLSECFITVGEKNIFDVFTDVFEFCKRNKVKVKIVNERDLFEES